MRFPRPSVRRATLAGAVLFPLVSLTAELQAQRETRPAAGLQGFDPAACRGGCTLDSLQVDVERGRRAQAGVVNATFILVDTVAQARRGAPPAPKERAVPVWIACDSTPCGAIVITGRVSDKRLDDARVIRRTVAGWTLPPALLARLHRSSGMAVHVDGRAHVLSPAMVTATRALLEPIRAGFASAVYSPRLQLWVASFALFGVPGDSTMAEDVGTATEPLMMVTDPGTSVPTRVATLVLAGRGGGAVPLLVQDDGTGAAPLFGIGEAVTVALPGRTGRRGAVSARVLARQRVEALRDSCQGMKVWTYLVSMSGADLATAQRGLVPSPRPGEVIDRWNGVAVRETFPPRMAAAEQRQVTASRSVVAQFVRERAATGVRERDVQVVAVLPRGAGLVTNFGVFARDAGGGWRFPTLTLRPATCPAG
ncbi:MAG: hypothetical protein IT355_03135 [Gemmatimonadaceae bacterium]|nr:hypothetical protein [Gemmatimonadaceae bacterium]